MQHKTVMTSNIVRAIDAMNALSDRGPGEEGMGLIYGSPGEGKTTCVALLTNRYDAVFLRANTAWTVTSMLEALMRELDLEPHYRKAPMIEAAIESLILDPRPIIIDEADYLLRQTEMMDAMRDIYDNAQIPVVLVMMEVAPRKIKSNRKLARFRRRITQWVEFDGLAFEDTAAVVHEVAEVDIGEDLIQKRIHPETRGKIGEIIIAIREIEDFADANNLQDVGLAQFGNASINPHGGR